ncbi:MAG TPA: ribosome biogenesis GTPase Der, partial [Actinomycetota bacterium]|nr:ribosome biogenesis GTPase Der [Actinomycetota bacterium]
MSESRRPVVAVVGRTNVGKSTLVNRLLGRREAIEHDMPGVTRDRQSYPVEWGRRSFLLVDTGGWEPRARGLAAKVVEQAERAAAQADLIVFVVDASTGAIGDDLVVARSLRRAKVPVIVVANKVDSAAMEDELHALQRLGLGDALPISALHGRGSGDVLDAIVATLPDEPAGPPEPEDRPLRVAVVGRPNAGKSSLFNRLTGQDRSIVDPTPGTTRDTVDETVTIGERVYEFIDTAGMRRRARQAEGPEYYGLVRSLRAIDRADVAIIVIDAEAGVTDQDQR